MRSGRACRARRRCWLVGLCLILGCGCASTQTRLEQALLADGNPAAHTHNLDACYRLRCPDVIDIQIDGSPDQSGPHPIEADGRIRIAGTFLRVVGQTTPETAHAVASRLRLPDTAVHVRVTEHNSQSLYLFGEADRMQRVVPYHGPETILDLLQRVGGTSPGSSPGDIQIVRAHIADGKQPEIFHVNLSAILFEHDLQSNICLEPFDRIYIAQSRRSRLACCVPPVLQPLYNRLCGIE